MAQHAIDSESTVNSLWSEDRLVGEYLRLEAEKQASSSAYTEQLKDLWERIQQAHADVHDPQQALPLEEHPAVAAVEKIKADNAGKCFSCQHDIAGHRTQDGQTHPCVVSGCKCEVMVTVR